MQSSASINLVKPKINILDELVKWALTFGRLLVIITEIVAFSSFVLRFSLDRTLVDLHDNIEKQQVIVVNLESREKIYRNLHERIEVAKTVSDQAGKNSKILNDIVNFTPSEITFNTFSIEGNKITIDTTVRSISALGSFVNSLRKYSDTSSVSIESINNSATGVINAKISVALKTGAPIK